MTYREFLESKIELAQDSGFVVDPAKINKALKPHQRDAVIWALKGGRRALFDLSAWERPYRRLNSAIRQRNTAEEEH